MKRTTFYLVSPSERTSHKLSARTGEQAVQFLNDLKKVCPVMPNDLCICTNECAHHFPNDHVVFEDGRFFG